MLEILDAETLDAVNDIGEPLYRDLSTLYNNLSALQRQNSIKWAQRARLMWVQCGDHSTSFFHNFDRFRNHYNNILHILDPNGSCFTDRQGIEQVYSDSFSNIWSEPFDNTVVDVLQALLNDLLFISSRDGE